MRGTTTAREKSLTRRIVRTGVWNLLVLALAAGTVLTAWPRTAAAQYAIFGRNKVQYDKFNWRVLNTPHFDIYYYEGNEESAVDAARIAERSYDYLSHILQVQFEDPVPLLLYADHQDFRQTNAVTGAAEGVQGVTESLKNRVVLPMLGSMEEFTHVLTHELVHAFQLEIMGVGGPANPMMWQPPLWMLEGMAEYLSLGMDPLTRVWLRDLVKRDEFLTLEEFETIQDQRVYRLGAGLYHFLGERYGLESIRRFFKETVRTRNWALALQTVYSMNPQQISDEWKTFILRDHADIAAEQTTADSIATRIIAHEGMVYTLNMTPAISPSGEHIAFVANKDLRDAVYVASTETGRTRRALASGGRTSSLEMIDLFESTMSWTADGSTLAFVSSGGSEDVIHLVEPNSGKTIRQLRYPNMTVISAALSPDGSQVVFSGMRAGGRDLYIASTDGGEPRRLTEDIYAYLHPAWSPDGTRIAVATDRGAPTNAAQLDFRGYRLALIDPASGEVEILTGGSWHDINPVWSPDGGALAFVSDRAGVPQIFLYELGERTIRKVTNLATGVTGITSSSPAISWSQGSGQLAFSSFREMGWDIYIMPDPRSSEVAAVEQRPDPDTEPHEPVWAGFRLGDVRTFEDERYGMRLQTDYIFGGGAFATNVGVIGDLAVGFSDMLGNHNLYLQASLYGSIARSNLNASYINLNRRLNWGVSLFQQATAAGGYYTSFTSTTYLSQVYRGAALMFYYPLNLFNRFESNISYVGMQQDIVSSDFFGRQRVNENLGRYTWFEVGGSFVHDSSLLFLAGPIGGMRSRLSLYHTIGDIDGTTGMADIRGYLTLNHRGALALRTYAGHQFGDMLQPFYLGGPFTVHGTSYAQMVGTSFAIQNVELRYPLIPWLPMQWDFITGALFADVGAIWDESGSPRWIPNPGTENYIFNGIIGAVGGGIRANLGWLALFLDYSVPTDFQGGWGNGRFQFALGQIF